VRSLPRLRGRAREGACNKTHARKLTPSPPSPVNGGGSRPSVGRVKTEFAARVDCSTPADSRDIAQLVAEPRLPFLFTCQTARVSSFLRRGFAPRFCFLCFAHPNRGVAERRETYGCLRGIRWACANGAGQAPGEAPCVPNGGRPPPGAPPWRFWAPVPRFLHQHLCRIRSASSSQPGRSAWRAGSRACRDGGYESPPRHATPRSTFGIISGDAPRRATLESMYFSFFLQSSTKCSRKITSTRIRKCARNQRLPRRARQ
jgi:hypothetical protein